MATENIVLTALVLLVTIAAAVCLIIARILSRHRFRCRHCGKVFQPKWTQMLFEIHALNDYKLVCPSCGVKDFCEDQGKCAQ